MNTHFSSETRNVDFNATNFHYGKPVIMYNWKKKKTTNSMKKWQLPYKFQSPQATLLTELPKNKHRLGPPQLDNKRLDPLIHMKFPPSAAQNKMKSYQ